MAYPEPTEVAPWYLRNITQALALDSATGNVYLRTDAQIGTLTIAGNVNIPGNVNANVYQMGNIPLSGNTLPVNVVGNVTVLQGTNPWVVTGNTNVAVTSGNVGITGNIAGITALPPITGNVSITGNANVAGNVGILGNVNVTQGTSPWVVSGNVGLSGTANVVNVGQNLDAFGRLRVSNPFTLFESTLTGSRRYDFSTALTGNSSVTFNYDSNVRELNVGAASADSAIRESMWTFSYQAGKSLLVMCSFVMAPAQTGLTQRLGYFTTNNGVYFEQANATVNMVIRSYSSGAITEERIPQGSWNGDKLNGTGPSGLTLSTTAPQIFYTDVEWLGAGSVRTGFIINGTFITCHTFNHANNPTFTTTYMGTATLPVRYEIANTGNTTGPSTLQQICCTVISEGGQSQARYTYSAGTGITTQRLVTGGTYYPIASIRLNSAHLNNLVTLAQVDVLSPTVNYYRWAVLKNATLTGATWSSASSTPVTDVDTAATAVTGGTEVESGFASNRENVTIALKNIYGQLGRTLQGVSDTFTLVIAATNNNADVLAQMGWQEIL